MAHPDDRPYKCPACGRYAITETGRYATTIAHDGQTTIRRVYRRNTINKSYIPIGWVCGVCTSIWTTS